MCIGTEGASRDGFIDVVGAFCLPDGFGGSEAKMGQLEHLRNRKSKNKKH
jgi:hypothetical protein